MKSFFDNFAKKREEKHKYKVLAAAIKTGDAAAVRAALANGATVDYYGGSHTKMPLFLALEKINAEIFGILLEAPQGPHAANFWHADFRSHDHVGGVATYFLPSYLYYAIEHGQQEIALLLAKKPGVNPAHSGEFLHGGQPYTGDYYKAASPLELARSKGMTAVVAVLEERLAPQLAQQAEKDAEKLEQLAAQKRAEAVKLLEEAARLSPRKPASPPPQNKLNI